MNTFQGSQYQPLMMMYPPNLEVPQDAYGPSIQFNGDYSSMFQSQEAYSSVPQQYTQNQQYAPNATQMMQQQNTNKVIQQTAVSCPACAKVCPNQFSLEQHMRGKKCKGPAVAQLGVPSPLQPTFAAPAQQQVHFEPQLSAVPLAADTAKKPKNCVKCHLCGTICPNESALAEHLNGKKHLFDGFTKPVSTFICHLCGAACPSQDALTKHLNGKKHAAKPESTPTDNVRVTCTCGVVCPNQASLNLHMNGRKHKFENMQSDIQMAGPPTQVACDLCGVICPNQLSLEAHKKGKKHAPVVQFPERKTGFVSCQVCSKLCPNQFSLQQHMASKHATMQL